MSVNKRLLEYHISRLKDKSPDVRIKSINELVLLGDPAALTVLQDVFKNDDDVEVRKAAQQAGRELFLKKQEQDGDA